MVHSGSLKYKPYLRLMERIYLLLVYEVLEKIILYYKWVIRKVFADTYQPYFVRDTTRLVGFSIQLSHELDFMNLHKAFIKSDSIKISDAVTTIFKIDHLHF